MAASNLAQTRKFHPRLSMMSQYQSEEAKQWELDEIEGNLYAAGWKQDEFKEIMFSSTLQPCTVPGTVFSAIDTPAPHFCPPITCPSPWAHISALHSPSTSIPTPSTNTGLCFQTTGFHTDSFHMWCLQVRAAASREVLAMSAGLHTSQSHGQPCLSKTSKGVLLLWRPSRPIICSLALMQVT